MHMPPPGAVRNSGPSFDQAFGQPLHRLLHFLVPTRELPDHMEKVVNQNPHLQPGLFGLETLAG